MADGPVGFSVDGARRIIAATKTVEEQIQFLRPSSTFADVRQPLLEGRLLGTLAAPSDSNAAPSASLRVYRGAGADWQPGEVVTVVNRQPGWSGTIGTQLVCVEVNGEWRPIVGTGVVGDGGTGPVTSFFCAPWVCDYIDGTLVDVSCSGITQAVNQYAFYMSSGCTCCDGRGNGQPVILTHVSSSCHWDSDSFACATTGGSCGTAVWKWVTSGGSIGSFGTAKFEAVPIPGCDGIVDTYQWVDSPAPGFWNIISTPCFDDCNGSTEPSSPGSYNGQTVTRVCDGGFEWLQTAYCNCGGLADEPTDPPTADGDYEYVACEPPFPSASCGTAPESDWYLISSNCTCGTAVKPDYPGSEGQIVRTTCRGPGSGYDSTARWQLTIAEPSYVTLLTESDVEILRYEMDEQKAFCPKCQNVFKFVGPCGPFDCEGWPDQICVGPYIPPLPDCNDLVPLPYDYDLAVSTLDNATMDALHGTTGVDWEAMNGTFTVSVQNVGGQVADPRSGATFSCLTNVDGTPRFGSSVSYTTSDRTLLYYSEDYNASTDYTDKTWLYGRWLIYVCCLADGSSTVYRVTSAILLLDRKRELATGTFWEYGTWSQAYFGSDQESAPGTSTVTLYWGGSIGSSNTATATFA